eukprot:COSAG02_NODE_17325_length_1012_cov_1.174151_1_plen_90_part_10
MSVTPGHWIDMIAIIIIVIANDRMVYVHFVISLMGAPSPHLKPSCASPAATRPDRELQGSCMMSNPSPSSCPSTNTHECMVMPPCSVWYR